MKTNKVNKPIVYILLILVLILVTSILLTITLIILRGDEDTWIQDKNGTWIKHGNPSAPSPEQTQSQDFQYQQIKSGGG
jgi:Na+-transporting NADH:ubiquinone oxidoreductase subunit NqrC